MERTKKRLRKNRLLASCLALFFLLAVSGTVALTAVPPAQKPAEAKSETASPEMQNYRYDPRGKLDPFKPFVRLEVSPAAKKGSEKKPTGSFTPLQRLPLEKIRVTGIAGSPEKRVAMVEDGGGKGFIISVGTQIGMNDGKVVQILPDQVIVEEKLDEGKGKEKYHRVALKLHKEEGEGKP
jgi:type IV pilus assembly protein PilP